jgi:U3 small nucleolar RNA-associated protein 7
LDLEFGSYKVDYSRNGNNLLLAGEKGHIALMKWKSKSLVCEFNIKERIKDVKFLQSENFYAVAQARHVFIYDH